MIKPLDLTHQELIQSRVLRQPREALSAGRALAVWLGLSLLGWGGIAAPIVVVVWAVRRPVASPGSPQSSAALVSPSREQPTALRSAGSPANSSLGARGPGRAA